MVVYRIQQSSPNPAPSCMAGPSRASTLCMLGSEQFGVGLKSIKDEMVLGHDSCGLRSLQSRIKTATLFVCFNFEI